LWCSKNILLKGVDGWWKVINKWVSAVKNERKNTKKKNSYEMWMIRTRVCVGQEASLQKKEKYWIPERDSEMKVNERMEVVKIWSKETEVSDR
jgi:hypothetical protein